MLLPSSTRKTIPCLGYYIQGQCQCNPTAGSRVDAVLDILRGGGSDEHPVEAEAAAPSCAGFGDRNEAAWICYECASCLCKPEQWMQMPEYALANMLFLGRLHPLLQKHGTLGLRLLLGLGIPCFRKLLLGKGNKGKARRCFAG